MKFYPIKWFKSGILSTDVDRGAICAGIQLEPDQQPHNKVSGKTAHQNRIESG